METKIIGIATSSLLLSINSVVYSAEKGYLCRMSDNSKRAADNSGEISRKGKMKYLLYYLSTDVLNVGIKMLGMFMNTNRYRRIETKKFSSF